MEGMKHALPDRVSTGLTGLDEAIGGLAPGENVVWQINDLADYIYVANRFVMHVARSGQRIVYFRFGEHQEIMDAGAMALGGANTKMYEIDPHIGFESFTVKVNRIIQEEGEGVFYLFDCLTELQKYWFSDLMVSNFFLLTNPYLSAMKSVGYFSLLFDHHTRESISRIRHAAPLLLNMRTKDAALYMQVANVAPRRKAKVSYYPLRLQGDKWDVLTSSVDNTGLFDHFVQVQDRPDSWDRMVADMAAGVYSEEEIDNIRQCLLGIEPQRLELCRQYFGVQDLLDIARREIGTGCIGGKSAGMLLARNVLRDTEPALYAEKIEPHDSYFIGADVFYTYFVDNDCWRLRKAMQEVNDYITIAPIIRDRMLTGKFNRSVREQFLSMLEYFGQSPIIVRSSSLLEDGFGNAFAGKYESVFCANQGTLQERYEVFEQAVRTVYASTMSPDAIQYRAQRNLLARDEQMALLVMRVSGDCHGKYYYPHMGGVGHSKDLYLTGSNKSTENKGMLRLVYGMGTRAVDREADDYARLISLDNPRAPIMCHYGDEYKFSQHNIDAIDLENNEFVTIPATAVPKEDVKADMRLFTEPDMAAIQRFRELGIRDTPPEIFSFKKLLWQTDFPDTMTKILQTIAEKYAYPVDIEYAVNFRPGGTDYRVNLLQCRPLQSKGVGSTQAAPELKTKLYQIRGNFMGGNMCQNVDYIVRVAASAYLKLPPQQKYAVARAIGTINEKLRGQDAVLLGPGRWGTSTISLGVPVGFMEICNYLSIAEVSYNEGGLVPELSYGSHFFQDLVEAGTFYTAIHREEHGVLYHAEALSELPEVFTELVPEAKGGPLEDVIFVHDAREHGAMLYAEIESQNCFLGWN